MHKGQTNIMFSFSGTAKSGQMQPNCNDYFDCLIKKKKKENSNFFFVDFVRFTAFRSFGLVDYGSAFYFQAQI